MIQERFLQVTSMEPQLSIINLVKGINYECEYRRATCTAFKQRNKV